MAVNRLGSIVRFRYESCCPIADDIRYRFVITAPLAIQASRFLLHRTLPKGSKRCYTATFHRLWPIKPAGEIAQCPPQAPNRMRRRLPVASIHRRDAMNFFKCVTATAVLSVMTLPACAQEGKSTAIHVVFQGFYERVRPGPIFKKGL
jgi:hypothetical protein